MNLINMNHLYYFSIIAKEKSISKASKVLHVTQPALSHQLKQLEEELGCKLFDRVGRGLELNQNGVHLLEFTNHVTRQTDNVRMLLKEKKQNKFVRLVIGVDVTISNGILYKFLRQALLVSDLKIEIVKSDINDLETKLVTNEIDIVISINPNLRKVNNLYSLPIDLLKIVCVLQKDNFNKRNDVIEELENKLLISYCRSSPYREIIDAFLLGHNIQSKSRIEVTCPWVALDLVYHGIGATFVPENMLLWKKEQNSLVELTKIDMIPLQVHAIISEQSIGNLPFELIVKSHQKFISKHESQSHKTDLNHIM